MQHATGYYMETRSAYQRYLCLDKGDFIHPGDNIAEQKKKGVFVKYCKNSKCDTILASRSYIIIHSYVSEVVADSDYVVVDQKPLQHICECNKTCRDLKYKGKEDLPSYKMCVDALKNSNNHAYWIIIVKNDHVFGPFTLEEFYYEKQRMKVPQNLKLSSESTRYQDKEL